MEKINTLNRENKQTGKRRKENWKREGKERRERSKETVCWCNTKKTRWKKCMLGALCWSCCFSVATRERRRHFIFLALRCLMTQLRRFHSGDRRWFFLQQKKTKREHCMKPTSCDWNLELNLFMIYWTNEDCERYFNASFQYFGIHVVEISTT